MKKIVAEIGAALLIAFFTGLRFTSCHGLAGIETIPVWSSYVITVFLVVLIINAVNLIDGIDGLAASVGIIASVVFGTWFSLSGDYGYAIMAGACWHRSAFSSIITYHRVLKIFMGDSGCWCSVYPLSCDPLQRDQCAGPDTGTAVVASVSIAVLFLF